MANKKVSDLPTITSVLSTDYIVIDRMGIGPLTGTKSTSLSSIADYILSLPITATAIKNTSVSDIIPNATITTEKIIDNSITSEKIINNSITTEKIIDNSITSEKITNNSITVSKLGSDIINLSGGLELTSNGVGLISTGTLSSYTMIYDGTKWNAGKIKLADISTGDIPKGSNIVYDNITQTFVTKNVEITTISEQGYIKKMAVGYQAVGGYAAITTDNRVITWGTLHAGKYPVNLGVASVNFVRVPFWTNYDGYVYNGTPIDSSFYSPYGNDYLDENADAEITDLLWSNVNGTAIVKEKAEDAGGDIWVYGLNTGPVTAAYLDPSSIVLSPSGDSLLITESGGTKINRLFPEYDLWNINPLSATPNPKDITKNKLDTDESYYFTCANQVKKIDKNGVITNVTFTSAIATQLQGLTGSFSVARFRGVPEGIVQHPDGSLYVCDTAANNIKKLDFSTNLVTIVAGATANTTTAGTADGAFGVNRFTAPIKITINDINSNILYVSENHRIRKLEYSGSSWTVSTLAGSTGASDAIGTGANTRFSSPKGLYCHTDNGTTYLYVVDSGNKKIKRIDVATGNSENFINPIVENSARFTNLAKGTTNGTTSAFWVDSSVHKIKAINLTTEDVYTYSGSTAGSSGSTITTAKYNNPVGITYLDNKLYIGDQANYRIRVLDTITNIVSVFAGTGSYGYTNNSVGTKAKFRNIDCIRADSNKNLYVCDSYYHIIRKIETTGTNTTTTLAGIASSKSTTLANSVNSSGTSARFNVPTDCVAIGNYLYVTDSGSHTIKRISLTSPYAVTIFAGVYGSSGFLDSSVATVAKFNSPIAIEADSDYLYVSDFNNHRIRRISLTGTNKVDTIVGTGIAGIKNGIGSNSTINNVTSIVKINNYLYIGDKSGYKIRKIDLNNNFLVSTVNGDGISGDINTVYSTLVWTPYGLTGDDDNLYFTDTSTDLVGVISQASKKISIYNKYPISQLGLGVSTGKSTSGFIKCNIKDNGERVLFKSVKTLGDVSSTFAALDVNDSLWVWGSSLDGCFGVGVNGSISPVKIKQFENNVKDYEIIISTNSGTGANTIVASIINVITKDNRLYSSGDNTYGQLARNYIGNQGNNRELIFEICKKQNSLSQIVDVDDAASIVKTVWGGWRNNMYVSTDGLVYACGNNYSALLANGLSLNNAENQPYFTLVPNITEAKNVYIVGRATSPGTITTIGMTAFALTSSGNVYAWGYNGINKGQTLTNNMVADYLTFPEKCWDYDKKTYVDDAVDFFVSDNAGQNVSIAAYIDEDKYIHVGGYSADVLAPDFPTLTQFFKKCTVKNVKNDVVLEGQNVIIHRENGTVYTVGRYGPQKIF